MKVLAAILVTLLLLAPCPAAPSPGVNMPTTCCLTYHKRSIPRRLVRSVFVTSSSCVKPGVVVITKKGKMLCAEPQEPWVEELLRHFQSLGN